MLLSHFICCALLQDICEADSAVLCDKLADSISSSMGGTSGALLEILFRAAATFLSTKVLEIKSESDLTMSLRAAVSQTV